MKVFLLMRLSEATASILTAIARLREATKRFLDDFRHEIKSWSDEPTIVVRVVPRDMFILTNHIAPGGVWRFPDMRAHKRQRHPRWNGG